MSDKLPSIETILEQSIAKAQMCQDIFRRILHNRDMTRQEILDYILEESEALVLLSEQLLESVEQEMKAKLEARNKLIAAAEKVLQDVQAQQVREAKNSGDKV